MAAHRHSHSSHSSVHHKRTVSGPDSFLLFISLLAVFMSSLSFIGGARAAPMCGLVPPSNSGSGSSGSGSGSSGSGPGTGSCSNSSTGGGNDIDNVVATGWYPGWLGGTLAPEDISWEKYNSLTFAFALTTPDASQISLDAQSAALLPRFVSAAHANGVNATLSIGGWTGSIYFSTAVATADNRTTFLNAVKGLVTQYELDGIDFDWEYPNKQGIGCNTISPQDSANFLSFLQLFRSDPVLSKLSVSVAVGLTPFAGADGTPMTDVSEFAKVIDHISIMDYDVWGSWSNTVGPNAPLDDSCATTKAGSATSGLKAWTDANFPASQIALAVAAYGHSFSVTPSAAGVQADGSGGPLALYPPFNKSQQPLGDTDVPGAPPSVDQCGNTVSGPSGVFNFNGMIEFGYLNGTGQPAPDIDYIFDTCSQTPFVYSAANQTMISFDDATSFAAKGKFINDNGMAGFAMWHIAGDSNDILVDAISNALNIAPSTCN